MVRSHEVASRTMNLRKSLALKPPFESIRVTVGGYQNYMNF